MDKKAFLARARNHAEELLEDYEDYLNEMEKANPEDVEEFSDWLGLEG